MGRDIHAFVEIYNAKSKEWDEIAPIVNRRMYDNTKKAVKVDFWEGRNSELFDILDGEEDYFTPHRSVPDDLSAGIKAEYEKDFPKDNTYAGHYHFSWTTFAELYIAYLENPKVPDYNAEWVDDQVVYKTNPLKFVIDKMIFYVEELYGEWSFKDVISNVRLVFWFDN